MTRTEGGPLRSRGVASRARARWRFVFIRLPQIAMLHQRRRPALLVSRKSQPQASPGHDRTRPRPGEVAS